MVFDVFGIVGSMIGGSYRVDAVVAEGGFAVVYRAFHTKFRASVALKCLKIPGQLREHEQREFLEQFRAEAELLFQLSASLPTVVRPLHVDAFTTRDKTLVPFMALEWLEGETLDAIIGRRKESGQDPLSLPELVTLLTPVARALERAHKFDGPQGPISIVHRDLKPENIFVASVLGDQVVKILDFGIGKAKSVASQVAGRASLASTGLASFTPAYGAPEQWLPKRYGQTGPWTDVWGLGLTIVEAMAARPVLEGDQTSMMGTALDERRRPTPRNEGVRVTDAVEMVFERALAVDPRQRYADAGQFWNALLAALGVAADPDPRVPSAARVPALPAIPDLQITALPRARPSARAGSGLSHGELELDDSISFELALDLPPNERSLARAASMPSLTPELPEPAERGILPIEVESNAAPSSLLDTGAALSNASTPPRFAPARQPVAEPSTRLGALGIRLIGAVDRHGEAGWLTRSAPGFALLGLSIAVTLADQAYAAHAGEVFSLGPLRPLWIAVAFMLSGFGWLGYQFLARR